MNMTGALLADKGQEEVASSLAPAQAGMEGTVRETGAFVPGFGAKVFAHDFMDSSAQPFVSPDRRFLGFAVGELYPDPGGSSGLARLFECFLEPGFQDWKNLNGQFVFAAYDQQDKKLFLVNDRFGFRPLYYRVSPGALYFSTRIAGLCQVLPRRPELSTHGVAELILFGHHFGETTLFEDIHCLPPGSALSFDGRDARIRRYWRPVYAPDPAVSAPELAEALAAAAAKQVRADERQAILLSGGLDSRLVAREARKTNPRLAAFTFGEENSRDVAYAKMVCSRLDIAHHHLIFDPGKWAAALPEVARQAEGEADIRHFGSGQFHQNMGRVCDIILTGLSGDMIMGSFIEDQGLARSPEKELTQSAFASSLQHPLETAAALFQPGRETDLLNVCREGLIKSMAGNPNELDADKLDAWNIENRQRRFILIGAHTDRYRFHVRSPFYDYGLFDLTLRIPAAKRMGEKLYLHALWRMMPELRSVPWQKTGYPPDPLPLRLLIRKAAAKIKRKIKPAPPRQRLFINPGGLIREGFPINELVRMLAQTPRRWHSIIDPRKVQTTIEQHFSGSRDHASLITKFLTLAYTEQIFLENNLGEDSKP